MKKLIIRIITTLTSVAVIITFLSLSDSLVFTSRSFITAMTFPILYFMVVIRR